MLMPEIRKEREIMKLSEALPDNTFVGDGLECATRLGWEVIDNDDGTQTFECCGERVSMGGWIGVNHCGCKHCHKGMTDLRSPLPSDGSCVQILNPENYEDFPEGPAWCDINFWNYP